MPLRIPDKLPAIEILKKENIFVMDNTRATNQDIRPLRIVVLNLMPIKITTETDLIRLLSNTPLQIEIDFMKLKSHTPKNTPIEQYDYKDVAYWDEISQIFAWAKTHVTSTLYICWAAQAGLYYHYGIPKYPLKKKMFGVFAQKPLYPTLPIFRGFDDQFFMPQSRHTEVKSKDILNNKALTLIAESEESGASIIMARGGREFFVTGHMEYSPLTLDKEYKRDMYKRDDVDIPINYYRENNPSLPPIVQWRAHANLFFSNWINYYVYQETPYDINKIV